MKILLCTIITLFSFSSYAGNAHVPCNLTDPDKKDKEAAVTQVDDLFRTPAGTQSKTTGSIDEEREEPSR